LDLISIKWPDFALLLVLFIVTILICHRLVFWPILNIFDSRKKLTEGNLEKAKEMEHNMSEKIKTVETEIKKARKFGVESREKLIKEGQKEQAFLIHSAKETARHQSLERESQEKEWVAAAESQIEVLSSDIADLMVAQYKG
jgi:F0F1-type ATP synthase membrane subunit b/b'